MRKVQVIPIERLIPECLKHHRIRNRLIRLPAGGKRQGKGLRAGTGASQIEPNCFQRIDACQRKRDDQ